MRENTQCFNQRQEMHVQSYEIFHYKNTMLDSVDVHHHDFYEVYLFLGGKVDYSVEGRNYHLEPGDVLMISPLEPTGPGSSRRITHTSALSFGSMPIIWKASPRPRLT